MRNGLADLLLDIKKRLEHEIRMAMEDPYAEQPGSPAVDLLCITFLPKIINIFYVTDSVSVSALTLLNCCFNDMFRQCKHELKMINQIECIIYLKRVKV